MIDPQLTLPLNQRRRLLRVHRWDEWGEPEDVADAIVLPASAPARWLTGQLLYVGGGWRMPQ